MFLARKNICLLWTVLPQRDQLLKPYLWFPALDYKIWNDTMENCIYVPEPINFYSKKAKVFHGKQCHIFEQLEDQLA